MTQGWYVGHNRDGKFIATFFTAPWWTEALETVGDKICGFSGHRLERLYGKVNQFAYERQKVIVRIEVTPEEAYALVPSTKVLWGEDA